MRTHSIFVYPRSDSEPSFERVPALWIEHKGVFWLLDIPIKVVCFEIGYWSGSFIFPMVFHSVAKYLGFDTDYY
jgi:hypothetical protein